MIMLRIKLQMLLQNGMTIPMTPEAAHATLDRMIRGDHEHTHLLERSLEHPRSWLWTLPSPGREDGMGYDTSSIGHLLKVTGELTNPRLVEGTLLVDQTTGDGYYVCTSASAS